MSPTKRASEQHLPWWSVPEYRRDGEPHVAIVTVTPYMAQQLLAANPSNRAPKKMHRKVFAELIERGEWTLSPDALAIGRDDRLQNGQHRSGAIVDAGVAVPMVVLFNVDPETKKITDQGAKRSFGDVLHIEGEHNAKALAAVVKNVFWWEHDGVPVAQNRRWQPTVKQLLDVLDWCPTIRESITAVGEQPLMTRAFAAVHHYVFSLADGENADAFFDLLRSGENLTTGHPIHTLRERLLREKTKASSGLHTTVRSAFMHRTWHAWMNGESLARLSFRIGGARPDRFPVVVPEEG